MPRKRHTKSRYGCKECKQRHMKCDEGRPSCAKCVGAGRRCSLLGVNVAVPPTGQTTSMQASDSSIGSLTNSHSIQQVDSPDSSALGRLNDRHAERYSLLHLELLHHPEKHYGSLFGDAVGEAREMVELIRQEALTVPYLMDEFLALAAAHKSTLVPADQQAFYRTEATRLQTRALSQADLSESHVFEQNYMAAFLFASLLSQHVLFDTFSVGNEDGAKLLDQLVHCFGLHRGIRVIAGRAWPQIEAQMLPIVMGKQRLGIESLSATGPGDECDALKRLAFTSPLAQESRQACMEAVDILQCLFDEQRTADPSGTRRVTVVQGWPTRIPALYVDLISQRVPEALVILAYYGVLLDRARGYWAVGDAGMRLVECVSSILGGEWAECLEWPRRTLQADKSSAEAVD